MSIVRETLRRNDREKGELGVETLRAVKRSLDPEGISKPGVWL
jgi:hypothetical protein